MTLPKDLTRLSDYSAEQIMQVLDLAFEYKRDFGAGKRQWDVLKGKAVAMIFEKASLRTKTAFEIATASLGGIPVYLTSQQILASAQNEQGRESIEDIARNLERFADIVMARVYTHSTVMGLACSMQKPVVNLLCDQHHPTQALADLMAIRWHKERFPGLTVAFIGDGNNVANSLMEACALLGMHFRIASPTGYELPEVARLRAQGLAERSGATLRFLSDADAAAKDADVLYTDTFVSMGQEAEKEQRLKDFVGFTVDMHHLKLAQPDALFMHCLPAHRGEEVTSEVLDSTNSIIFDEAECRMHIARSLLTLLLAESPFVR